MQATERLYIVTSPILAAQEYYRISTYADTQNAVHPFVLMGGSVTNDYLYVAREIPTRNAEYLAHRAHTAMSMCRAQLSEIDGSHELNKFGAWFNIPYAAACCIIDDANIDYDKMQDLMNNISQAMDILSSSRPPPDQ